jgi:hypothetical protein
MRGGRVSHRSNRTAVLALAAALATLPGCDWVQDRFRDCRHLRIDLENRFGSEPPVNLVLEGEPYADANLVPWLTSRRVEVCAELGDVKRFRVGRGNVTLDIANCVVSRQPYEFEQTVSRVAWDHGQLLCENW